MMLGTHFVTCDMTKKQKNKKKLNVTEAKDKIQKARNDSPEHVDWALCADTVDELHVWINELCLENHKLKQLLEHVIERLREDNAQTTKILEGLEPKFKNLS